MSAPAQSTPLLADTAPLLTTDRFELWRPRASDRAALFDLVVPEETRRFLGNRPTTEMDEALRLWRSAGSWALYGYGLFVCREHGRVEVVGTGGVFRSWRGFAPDQGGLGLDDVPEAGWIIDQRWWGKRVASETMQAALAWFDSTHRVQRIACMIEEGHHASLRLADALGFEAYAVHQGEDGERPLVLLERLNGGKPEVALP